MKSKSINIKLLVATSNPGKLKEIRRGLKGLPLKILGLEDEAITARYREKGKTFMENAKAKGLFYSQFTDYLTLAEDSGLEVEALKGEPGVLSARYAGYKANDEKNIAKLLARLKDFPLSKRKARFVCCLCLAKQGKILKCFRGEVRGWIIEEKRGHYGFGYDPIFFYRPFNRTFAELPPEKKNLVSHRGRALRRLRRFLEKNLGRLLE